VTVASPEEFLRRSAAWADHGLSGLPVEIQGVSGSYAATPVALEWGKPFVFRFVVGTPPNVRTFKRALDANDHAAVGHLLGYPPCCYEFFRRVWIDESMVDTTWPMAANTAGATNGTPELTVAGPPESNILWRWMGVRAVPHLPCRFDCEPTAALGRRFLDAGRGAGYGVEMAWLLEILRWPVEWSALHGIAEIRTPIMKVSTRTDATAHKYVVRRPGDAYPAEGVQGLGFPYRAPGQALFTASPAYRRGLENQIRVLPGPGPSVASSRPPPDWHFTDNGFSSAATMEACHVPIVDVVATTLAGRGGAVLDLGCGNGALLERIQAACPNSVPVGIDADPERIAHARTRLPGYADRFVVGDLFDSEAIWPPDRRYALALVMPGRLLEAGLEQASRLRARLRAHCDQVVAYAYGDWLIRYGGLRGLAEAAGLRLRESREGITVAPVEIDELTSAEREVAHERG
jgi:SAM-dependent methyltransferase